MNMHLRTTPCSLVHLAKPPALPARRIRTHAQQDVKEKPASEAGNAAFRWNPAQQRWEKKEGALAEGADLWVKPLVCGAMHMPAACLKPIGQPGGIAAARSAANTLSGPLFTRLWWTVA